MILTNPVTAEHYEPAFGAEQPDQRITVIKQYMGPLSGITPEAAETYVKQGGNLLKRKTTEQAVQKAKAPVQPVKVQE